jgi:LmbE family N-acetylglucosaminyl deacetylase
VVIRDDLGALLAASPQATIEELCGGGDVVVLAPHPDDETLGCGLAIAAASEAGHRVQVVFVTDGRLSHPNSRRWTGQTLADLRRDESIRAVATLSGGKAMEPIFLDYKDTEAPVGEAEVHDAQRRIVARLDFRFSAIWTTWSGDPHVDHRRTAVLAEAVFNACSNLKLWHYPIWGRFTSDDMASLPEQAVTFADPRFMDRKQAALAAYASQMTRLIDDDPDGFVMDQTHQTHFLQHPEIFFDRSWA